MARWRIKVVWEGFGGEEWAKEKMSFGGGSWVFRDVDARRMKAFMSSRLGSICDILFFVLFCVCFSVWGVPLFSWLTVSSPSCFIQEWRRELVERGC